MGHQFTSAAVDEITYRYCAYIWCLCVCKQKAAQDIVRDVEKIVDLGMAREYVAANDWYLRMSIGNAPWPMGVTMVGIHERSARTKIFSNKVARASLIALSSIHIMLPTLTLVILL